MKNFSLKAALKPRNLKFQSENLESCNNGLLIYNVCVLYDDWKVSYKTTFKPRNLKFHGENLEPRRNSREKIVRSGLLLSYRVTLSLRPPRRRDGQLLSYLVILSLKPPKKRRDSCMSDLLFLLFQLGKRITPLQLCPS